MKASMTGIQMLGKNVVEDERLSDVTLKDQLLQQGTTFDRIKILINPSDDFHQ